jgi:hypothetical protein
VGHASEALGYLNVVHDLVHTIGPDLVMSATNDAREYSAYTVELTRASIDSRRFAIIASSVVARIS